MKVVCPVCQAAYRFSGKRDPGPLARALCKRCGTYLLIDRDTGQVSAQPPKPEAAPGPASVPEPEDPGPASEPGPGETAPEKQPRKDYLAVGYVVAVVAVSIVLGLVLTRKTGGFISSPVRSIIRWVRSSEGYLKDKLKEKARDILPFGDETKDPKKLVKRGYKNYKNKNYKEAIEQFDRAIKLDPKNPKAYFWRGRAHVKRGRHDEAMADFMTTIELDPKYAPAYDNLGWLYGRKNKHDEKIRYLTKSIELKPDNGWTYYSRGQAYFTKGDLENALKDAKKACDLGYKRGCEVYEKHKDRLKPAEESSK